MEDDNLSLLYKNPETLGFYASPEHPLAGRKSVKEEDLKGVPLLLTGHNCSFRHMLMVALEHTGIYPDIELETTSKEILKQFAMNNLGVAFMPDMAAEDELERKKLVRLKWKGSDFPIFSQIFIHKDKHGSRAIREFVEMVSA